MENMNQAFMLNLGCVDYQLWECACCWTCQTSKMGQINGCFSFVYDVDRASSLFLSNIHGLVGWSAAGKLWHRVNLKLDPSMSCLRLCIHSYQTWSTLQVGVVWPDLYNLWSMVRCMDSISTNSIWSPPENFLLFGFQPLVVSMEWFWFHHVDW